VRRSLGWVLGLALLSSPVGAETTVRFGVATSSLQFDFLYSDYGVERVVVEREVAVLGEPDLLVALHLCRVTGTDLEVVVGWRRSGMSWDDITRRCRRDGSIYYVELPPDVTGPPYGRACGHWKKHPRSDVHPSDAEIREFVLVRSVASHCGMSAGDVVHLRARGESPKAIDAKRSGRHHEDAAPPAPSGKRQGNGHGKGGKNK
jgi:hypothetical protein